MQKEGQGKAMRPGGLFVNMREREAKEGRRRTKPGMVGVLSRHNGWAVLFGSRLQLVIGRGAAEVRWVYASAEPITSRPAWASD